MQAVNPLQRTPVAAIGHALRIVGVIERDQAAGNRLPIAHAQKQQPVLGHGVLHALKKVTAQVGRVAVLEVGALIAAVEKIPIAAADLLALLVDEFHTCIAHFAPLLADFFALVLRQACQKFIEITVSGRGIGPVELHGVAQHQAGLGAAGGVFFGAE